MFLKKILNSSALFTVASLIILYLGYSQNLWKAADYEGYYDYNYYFLKKLEDPFFQNLTDSYPTFDRFAEALVLGRLVKSRKDGIFSSGGFTGYFYDHPRPSVNIPSLHYTPAYQYKLYLDDSFDDQLQKYGAFPVTLDSSGEYRSQFGGQAFILGILDKIMLGENSFKLRFYYNLMSFLTTLAVFLIIFWFYKEFGIVTGWLLVVSFALFNYPTLYANNLWYVPWAFYIPFLVILYPLHKEDVSGLKLSSKLIFILSFCGMFIKIFFNGFEYILPTMIMAVTPIFYYCIKNKWKFTRLISYLGAAGAGITLSFMISFMVLSFQFVLAGDSFSDGLLHIYNTFLKRTYGGGAYTDRFLEVSHQVPLYLVVKWSALNPPAFDFRNMGINFMMRIRDFLILFFGTSIVWVLLSRMMKIKGNLRKIDALNYTLWLSILAPLSWLVVFKGHSYIHQQHDPIVWFMPFMFYGIGLLGSTVAQYLKRVMTRIEGIF